MISRTAVGELTVGEVRVDDGPLVLARLDGDPAIGDRVEHIADDIVRFARA